MHIFSLLYYHMCILLYHWARSPGLLCHNPSAGKLVMEILLGIGRRFLGGLGGLFLYHTIASRHRTSPRHQSTPHRLPQVLHLFQNHSRNLLCAFSSPSSCASAQANAPSARKTAGNFEKPSGPPAHFPLSNGILHTPTVHHKSWLDLSNASPTWPQKNTK